ncbi:MAG TPA: DUF362 domain-containing protein [Phycisphaerae bacterium]|nr:DUF362 domain-containing protein [Phycisphaerae bacterium]
MNVPRSSRSLLPRFARVLAAALVFAVVAGAAWAGPTVAIVKGTDVPKMVAEAMDLLGGVKQFVKDGQKVVIKPNVVGQPCLNRWGRFRGPKKVRNDLTTDVRIAGALARQMLKAARCKITIAEGTPNHLPSLYEFLGYTKLSKELGIDLVDVDAAKRMIVKRKDLIAREQYEMPVVTQTCDVLVNMPVMKTHQLAVVTLGMKNLFGLLPLPKNRFHRKYNGVLCDLVRMRRPDLVIVDGLVATEGQGPLQGTPIRMDLIVAGRDIVAVDTVCTVIMGFDPRRVQHLVLAHENGLGETDLDKITIKGAPIASVRRQLKHARWWAAIELDYSEKLIEKLLKLADHVHKGRRGEWRAMSFDARHLKVDKKKYPTRESAGFRINMMWPPRPGKIVIEVPFKAMYEENGRAAADEMAEWIRQNLGKDVKMVKNPWAEAP